MKATGVTARKETDMNGNADRAAWNEAARLIGIDADIAEGAGPHHDVLRGLMALARAAAGDYRVRGRLRAAAREFTPDFAHYLAPQPAEDEG